MQNNVASVALPSKRYQSASLLAGLKKLGEEAANNKRQLDALCPVDNLALGKSNVALAEIRKEWQDEIKA